MALWVCGGEAGCGTKYAVGLSRCPRCHQTEFFEDGDPMAKITRSGGVTDDAAPAAEDAAAAEADPTPPAAADQSRADVSEQREDSATGEPTQPADAGEQRVEQDPAAEAPSEGAAAETGPEAPSEKAAPDEGGTATLRRSRRRNQTAE